jgi:hypothetical protein
MTRNMKKGYINVTPHNITFFDHETGSTFVVEPCGVVISATPQETIKKVVGDITFVQTDFVADEQNERCLAELEAKYPDAIIVGSIIAAQAFPGRVMAMTPAPGYERVPPAEKRMNPRKFTTF